MRTHLHNRSFTHATALSWLAWLLAVAVFAIWTLDAYQAPAEPAWVGMTIHTAVFAIWTLIARDWFALWLARRGRQPARRR
jgi:hypothetical protein